jgi:polygalacturonase
MFGIKSNGTTLNTTSIQKAIDYISENGGGTLEFTIGRYLTGAIVLKSNVTINLVDGAILLGSTNPYDYLNGSGQVNTFSLVSAYRAENIAITGEGIIDGQGAELGYNLLNQQQKGIIPDIMTYDRPGVRPNGVYLRECKNVTVTGITIKSAGGWSLYPDQCEDMLIDGVTVFGLDSQNNDGIDIVDCKNLRLFNAYINTSGDAICFKSHDQNKCNEHIDVHNCVARSSGSAIKFGTTTGGYRNIHIVNNKVYKTCRSALTIEVSDGGFAEDILVDSLYAYNTGNAVYLRIGKHNTNRPAGKLRNVTIQNMYCEIPAQKADAGFPYEGTIEDNPRNISPASIVGLTGGHDIENITLRNIRLVYPGGGNANYAYRGLKPEDLDEIPEMPTSYPKYSQFRELPAWAFWIRHGKNITFENISLVAKERDYRPAIVIQEAENVTLKKMTYSEPGGKKKQVHTCKAKDIVQK